MKKHNKALVGILTIFLNCLGVPHFVHGQVLAGIATILFGIVTFGIGFCVNFVFGVINGIRLMKMDADTYDSLETEQILAGIPSAVSVGKKENKTWIAVIVSGMVGMIIPMFDVYRLLCEYVVQNDNAVDIYRWFTSPIANRVDNEGIKNLISNVEGLFSEYLAVPLTLLVVVFLAVAFVIMLRVAIWGIQIMLNAHRSSDRSALLIWGSVVTAANAMYIPRLIIRAIPLLGIDFPASENYGSFAPAFIQRWVFSWFLPLLSMASTTIRYLMYAGLILLPIVFTVALAVIVLILAGVQPKKGKLEVASDEDMQ